MWKIRKRMAAVIVTALLMVGTAGCSGCNHEAVSQLTGAPVATEKPLEATKLPELTATPEPVVTATQAPTGTLTPEPVATATTEPTVAVTPEPTVFPKPAVTSVPEPTMTPEPATTATSAPTSTPKPTATPEPSATLEPTVTPTPTPLPVKGIVAGDYVTFGSYPQREITGADLTEDIINASYDEQGNAEVGGVRYARMSYSEIYEKNPADFAEYYEKEGFCYFLWEPVEWLVLETEEGKAFLLSRYVLDARAYDENYDASVWLTDKSYHYRGTWERSSIRAWLNNDFCNNAFTSSEQESILLAHVENLPGTLRDTSSGPDTKDKVYLLSESEAVKYFGKEWIIVSRENRPIREDGVYPEQDKQLGFPTGYAIRNGVDMRGAESLWSEKCCPWNLRTMGGPYDKNQFIYSDGFLNQEGFYVDKPFIGTRPILWLDLASIDIEKVK